MHKTRQLKKEKGISGELAAFLLGIWCFCVLAVVPLYAPRGYVEIGSHKWGVFVYSSLVLLPVCAVLAAVSVKCPKGKEGKVRPDIFKLLLLLFALSCVITTVLSYVSTGAADLSDPIMPAKWSPTGGLFGWYMGLLAQLIFVGAALCISYIKPKAKLLNILLILCTSFIFLIGLLNRFMIDPLGMFKGLDDYHYTQYLSTIGQNTWYSSYLVIMMSAGMYFYYVSEKMNARIAAAAYTILCSASLITQGSDCALLATGTAMAILFACSFEEKEKLLRWLELLLMILLSWRFIGVARLMAGKKAVDAGGLMSFLTQSPYLWLLPVAVLILWILVSRKDVDVRKYKKLRTALLLMIPAAIILGIGYIVLNTLGVLPQGLSSDNGYLLFDDEWGSARGIIWKSSVKVIVENLREHPLKLLFGEGPDAFTAAVYKTAGEALKAKWPGKLVPNAHNEWLNMLINYGLVGGGLYISLFVMTVKNCISGMKNRPELMLPLMCIAAYMVHNFFCYQQIICTAPAFVIMGTVFRKTEE